MGKLDTKSGLFSVHFGADWFSFIQFHFRFVALQYSVLDWHSEQGVCSVDRRITCPPITRRGRYPSFFAIADAVQASGRPPIGSVFVPELQIFLCCQ